MTVARPNNVGQQLAHKMHRVGVEITGASKTSVQRVARSTKTRLEASLRQGAPSMRLSGVGRSGAAIGVSAADVRSKGTHASALIRATGPLHLLERDTKAHFIDPTPRSRDVTEALVLLDGQLRGSVYHPGTKGKKLWEKGVKDATPPAVAEMRRSMTQAVVRGVRA